MCENCMHLAYDEETGDSYCDVTMIMDEDDYARIAYGERKQCPYYQIGDEYTIVRKQN